MITNSFICGIISHDFARNSKIERTSSSSKEGLSTALLLLVLIDEPEHVRTPVGARQLVELDPRRGRGADGPPRRAWARGGWEVVGRALARRARVRRARARWASRARSYLCAARRPVAWPASLAVALAAFPTAADLTERWRGTRVATAAARCRRARRLPRGRAGGERDGKRRAALPRPGGTWPRCRGRGRALREGGAWSHARAAACVAAARANPEGFPLKAGEGTGGGGEGVGGGGEGVGTR